MGTNKDIPASTKEEIMQFLLGNCINGKPKRGILVEAASIFNCSKRSISRIWESATKQMERGEVMHAVNKRKKRISHRKIEVNLSQIAQVEMQKRGTIRALAESINIPKSVVGRWAKSHLIRPHSNAIKPALTAPNMLTRLSFSLQAVDYDKELDILSFKPMENVVHIDEKWFYLTKNTHKYYITEGEEEVLRICKSKNFIPKIMFMCAVCRPIFSKEGNVIFDGKIGIWPFTEEVKAKRNSKRRAAGTIEIKPVESITKQVIKDCLINQIVPAIKSKWPECLSKTIYIQQDNARPHIGNGDLDFQAVGNGDGFNISLVQQPPNSPDCNVNDLGFFRAIQSLQQQQQCRDATDLVKVVISSFNTLEAMTLNKVFLSLQCCLKEIITVKGCNNYKIPHMKKNSLLLLNELPKDIEVPKALVMESLEYLMQQGRTHGLEKLIVDLGIVMTLVMQRLKVEVFL